MSSVFTSPWLRLAVLGPWLGITAVGCSVHSQDYRGGYYSARASLPECPAYPSIIAPVNIDTDAELTARPGQGVGVFVEYVPGGHWHIWTACDTAISGQKCAFEVTAQALDGQVANVASDRLEAGEIARSTCADTAFLWAEVGDEHDGIFFDTAPGAMIRVTAALGGAVYPNLVYWASDGDAKNQHASPVDLKPSAP